MNTYTYIYIYTHTCIIIYIYIYICIVYKHICMIVSVGGWQVPGADGQGGGAGEAADAGRT